MSREQTFVRIRRGLWRYVVPVAIVYQAATMPEKTPVRELPPATTQVSVQTNDLAPIFRCTGAGSQVVVSLGGDGSSIFAYCQDVKS